MALDPVRRRAALIASAIALPIIVLLAFALTAGHSTKKAGPTRLGPVVVTGPKANPSAAAACEKVVEKLPVTLDGMRPRTVHGSGEQVDTTYVVAWGDPAVILSCGVPRPASLKPGDADELFTVGQGGHSSLVAATHTKTANIFTVVDRAAYVAISVPKKVTKDPTAILAGLIAEALPVVCDAASNDGSTVPANRLCVNRP